MRNKFYKFTSNPVARNAGWLFIERMVRLGLGLIVGAWVARYLGPEKYGLLSYFLAYIALFSSVANLGLDGIVVRECSKNPNSTSVIINTALSLRLVSGLICWVVSSLFLFFTEDFGISLAIGLIVGCTLAPQSFDTIDLWFQSEGKNKISVYAKLTAFFISNLFKILLIFLKCDLYWFALLNLVEASMAATILFYAYKKNKQDIKISANYQLAKKLLMESWPYMLSSLSIVLYMRIDQIYIRQLLGDYYVGQYSVGIVFSQFWYFLPVIMSTSIAPHLAAIKCKSDVIYANYLIKIFRYFFVTGVLVTLFNYFAAGILIDLVYGNKYSNAISVLKIHSFTNIFVFMGVAQNLWLINEGKGRINLIKTGIGVVVAIAGNAFLVPKFGLIGAAYTAVIAQAFSAFISNIFLAPRIFLAQLGFNKIK